MNSILDDSPDVTILSYEKALVKPSEFVDYLIKKLKINPPKGKIKKAVSYIQPEFGFRDLTRYLR